jgi:hypothetical protein
MKAMIFALGVLGSVALPTQPVKADDVQIVIERGCKTDVLRLQQQNDPTEDHNRYMRCIDSCVAKFPRDPGPDGVDRNRPDRSDCIVGCRSIGRTGGGVISQ